MDDGHFRINFPIVLREERKKKVSQSFERTKKQKRKEFSINTQRKAKKKKKKKKTHLPQPPHNIPQTQSIRKNIHSTPPHFLLHLHHPSLPIPLSLSIPIRNPIQPLPIKNKTIKPPPRKSHTFTMCDFTNFDARRRGNVRAVVRFEGYAVACSFSSPGGVGAGVGFVGSQGDLDVVV